MLKSWEYPFRRYSRKKPMPPPMPYRSTLMVCLTQWLRAALLLCLCPLAFAADLDNSVVLESRGDAFILDAVIEFPATLRVAWEVLTDFDGMATFLSNLTASRVVARSGNTLLVQQEGNARYGFFSYVFTSEREIRLKPMKRISARQLSGNAKRFTSELDLTPSGNTTRIRYHAEVVPESGLARTFGGPFIRHEVEEQFASMAAEMQRREAAGRGVPAGAS